MIIIYKNPNICIAQIHMSISRKVILGGGSRLKMQRGISFSNWRCRRLERSGKHFALNPYSEKNWTKSRLTTDFEPKRVPEVQDPEHREMQASTGRDETQALMSCVSYWATEEEFHQGDWSMVQASWVSPGGSKGSPWVADMGAGAGCVCLYPPASFFFHEPC